MNILMVNLPFAGHTNPTLPLTRRLVERGHRVVYVNAPEFREKIERAGAVFVPYADYPANAGAQYRKRHCFEAAFHTAMGLTERFDVLIYEMFFYPGLEIARRKGIPAVRQFSQPAWSEETWRDAPGVFHLSARLIDAQVLPASKARQLVLAQTCLRDGIIRSRPELNIVYIPEAFQQHRECFDDSYLFMIPRPELIPGGDIPFAQLPGPIAYISLGSILSDRSFYKKCIKAFAGQPVSVILNTGKVPPASLGKLPGNIHAYSFVPQVEVLSHADVFLTHCGMNSINEALSFGVPMVAMPFINDQQTNAKQLVRLGVARRIHSFFQNTKEIRAAVLETAASTEMKQRAMELKENIDRQIAWSEVVSRIEALAR